jgi:hypothetical protein
MTVQISYRVSDRNTLIAVGTPLRALFWENGGPESHWNRVKVVWGSSEFFKLLPAPIPREELYSVFEALLPERIDRRYASFLVTFRPQTMEVILFDWKNLDYRYLFPPRALERVFCKAVTPALQLALSLGFGEFREWEWVWEYLPSKREEAEV